MAPGERALRRLITDHIEADEKRFDALEKQLSNIVGILTVLVVLVVGSGVLNFFSAHP